MIPRPPSPKPTDPLFPYTTLFRSAVTGPSSDRLRMNGTRVSGFEFIRDGERLFAESRIETVLASGSIGSPTILQRSGIGDATRLAALGVTPQHALPGVGANLQEIGSAHV